jgi:methionyl-tRNA formyltransferase
VRVVFAGTPEFALPAFEALRAHHQVTGVLTQPDRPSGRGRQLTESAVKRAALAGRLPVAQPETLQGAAGRELLQRWQPEVMVVVAYGLILPQQILDVPPLGCLNIHASLLPRWRGAAPIQRAILAGDAETGISIMRMEAGLDTGPVLLTRRLPIAPRATSRTLHEALAPLGAEAILAALEGLARATLSPVPQEGSGVTYAAKVHKGEGRIDWALPAAEIDRRIRAFTPWPMADTLLDGQALRILAAEPAESTLNESTSAHERAVNGSIVVVRDGKMYVRCGSGLLAVSRVQRPGRNPVTVTDFAHTVALEGRRLG